MLIDPADFEAEASEYVAIEQEYFSLPIARAISDALSDALSGTPIDNGPEPTSGDAAQRIAALVQHVRAVSPECKLLFISDIRSISPGSPLDEQELCVQADMRLQHEAHTILNPKASMLKFRLPYTAGITSYLEGDIHLPIWV